MSGLLPPERIARVCGFGMIACGDGYLFQPSHAEEILQVFDMARSTGRKIVLRGSGLSYGDANIAPEQIVLDCSHMNRILSWDRETGLLECEAGVTIEQMWRHVLPDGWWPPVVSGTMFPTLAGALAMNIHGKNAFEVGCLGEHVLSIEVLLPSGGKVSLHGTQVNRDGLQLADLVSSAGLLGVITRATVQMKRVSSGLLQVTPALCRNWSEQFDAFNRFQELSDYMVSWVDSFSGGSGAGRGLFHAATYIDGPAQTLRPESQDLPPNILGLFPKSEVWKVLRHLNRRGRMRMLNGLKHHLSRWQSKPYQQSLVEFSFLLDYVPNWRNAYLPGGFIQYQSFIPREHAHSVFAEQLAMSRAERMEPFLGVMKRHRPDRLPFLFSHAVDGYSLALDFKAPDAGWPKLQALCQRMNDLVLQAGGRFYFAKDSTLRPEDSRVYLGSETLARYSALKEQCDPEALLTSALAERLGLT